MEMFVFFSKECGMGGTLAFIRNKKEKTTLKETYYTILHTTI